MSKFILRPSKILQTRFVIDRTQEAFEGDFAELRGKLVPSGDLSEVKKLGMLRQGCFVGVSRHTKIAGKKNVFLFFGRNGVGDIADVLKTDPSFASRLEAVYRVEKAEYDAKVIDLSGAQA